MIPITLPVILLLLTFLIISVASFLFFIGWDYVARVARPVFEADAAAALAQLPISLRVGGPIPRVEGYLLPESLYYHAGHTWMALQESGAALVGIDDFASKLIGKATFIAVPNVGRVFKQGEKGWTLRRKGKDLDLASPIDGKVIAVNKQVIDNPEFLSKDPYGSGWLMLIEPRNLKRNLRSLLHGSVAPKWMEESAAELRSVFSGRLGLVYQDGGLPEDGLADYLEQAEWDKLINRIFVF